MSTITNNTKRIKRLKAYVWVFIVLLIPFSNGCAVFQYQLRPPVFRHYEVRTLQVTAYCACEKCCGWEYNRFGRPIHSYGPKKGKRKIVGMTASGIMAHMGTIAADTKLFPMGTIMYIEGYGYGKVEDRGSAIQGDHIDIFFKDHDVAMAWGNHTMEVKVWTSR